MHSIRAGYLAIELDERLGGEITGIRYRGRDLLATHRWASPVGVSRSASYGDARLDWLSEYRGGWQLLVPNAGAECEVHGTPLPFHGEWSRTQVTVTERSAHRVVMTAGLRLPLTVEREVRLDPDRDRVVARTSVTNTVDVEVPFVWGEHPAFTVGDGDLIDLPSVRVAAADGSDLGTWPDPGGAHLDRISTAHPAESVHYLTGFESGWAAIRRRDYGVALAWDVADMPVAWLWHEIASPRFPFFGRTSLVAIEPASSWPGTGLRDAVTRGQAIILQPGESRTTEVSLIPFETVDRAVTGVSITGGVEWAPA